MSEEQTHQSEPLLLAPGVRVLPVVHGSLEFTTLVRSRFLENPPSMIALELPENFYDPVMRAIPYADSIPFITMEHTESGREIHFILESLEPIVEAVRSAYEGNIPCHFVDLYNEDFLSWFPERFPDTFALQVMSVEELYESYAKSRTNRTMDELAAIVDRIDRYREIHMADRIRNLSKFVAPSEKKGVEDEHPEDPDGLLVVCGIKHVEGLRRFFSMSEEDFAREKEDLRSFFEQKTGSPFSRFSEDEEPLEALLNRQDDWNKKSGGDADRHVEFSIYTLSRESPEVLSQPGYYNTTWNLARKNASSVFAINRLMLQRYAYRDAVRRYEHESGELFPPQIEKMFFRFARNWSIIEDRLIPDAYRLVMSARAFRNDNFARIMYDVLHYLPPPSGSPFPERTLTLDDLFKDSKLIRFRMKMKRKKRVPPPKITKRFEKEKYPGQWTETEDSSGICSYPPEDVIIENYGEFLQQKARTMLRGSEERTMEFTSSLMDGIDYRETIRNLHLGKLYVKDLHKRNVNAGSVVIIFSHDEMLHNWKAVWWGEHNQESDMALYATPPGEHLVGPGIYRCSYGGLMMSHPPGRLHDIWNDPFFDQFPDPAERLLAAAIEFNDRTAVVYVAPDPPSRRMTQIAGRVGQKVVYIPLSTLDPVTIGRVRRFHVLDSKKRRRDADDYIW